MKRLSYMRNLFILVLSMALLMSCARDTKEGADTPTGQGSDVTAAPEPTSEPTVTPEPTAAAPTDVPEKLDIRIGALKGPTAIGMVKLMEDAQAETTAGNYIFTIAGTADEITAGLAKGELDIAAIPCNLASVLYNKTEGGIKLAGINTLGVLYIVETGDTIHSVEDLKGKTIYSTGLGTTPQYTLNYLLASHGLDPEKDVTIEYKTEATEVAAVLSEAEDAIAMLPQPYVTTVMLTNDKLRIALDIAEEWSAASTDGSTVVTGVVVVRSDFLTEHPEAFDAFLTEYAASAAFVNEKVDDAAALAEKFDIFKAAPLKLAIPYCNITLIRGDEMKNKVNGYLKVLYDQKPESVGGVLPGEDFYYMP